MLFFFTSALLQIGDGLLFFFFPSLLLFSAKSDQEFANRLKSGEKYHSTKFVLKKSEALLPAYYFADKVKTKAETFLIVEQTNAGTGQRTRKRLLVPYIITDQCQPIMFI